MTDDIDPESERAREDHYDRLRFWLDAGLPINGLGPVPHPNLDQPRGPDGPCCLRRARMEDEEEHRRREAFARTFEAFGDEHVLMPAPSEATLSQLRLAMRQVLPDYLGDTIDVRMFRDDVMWGTVLEIRLKILKEDMGREKLRAVARAHAEITLPVTWWDHWKWARLGSKWAVVRWFCRRYPPKLRTLEDRQTVEEAVEVGKHVHWPDLPIRPREWGRPVRFVTMYDR